MVGRYDAMRCEMHDSDDRDVDAHRGAARTSIEAKREEPGNRMEDAHSRSDIVWRGVDVHRGADIMGVTYEKTTENAW